MSFGEALIYSLLGICVVFFALILLMVIIKLMTAFSGEKKQPAPAAAAPAAAPEAKTAPGSAGDVKLYDTDPRTAAMLMAIVADELKAPLNELRFISIREVKENDDEI
ncbi:MAG: OadG family protein [Oscillospiraceae bacterium]